MEHNFYFGNCFETLIAIRYNKLKKLEQRSVSIYYTIIHSHVL